MAYDIWKSTQFTLPHHSRWLSEDAARRFSMQLTAHGESQIPEWLVADQVRRIALVPLGYTAPDGRKLFLQLLEIKTKQGFTMEMALILLPNCYPKPGSVHERLDERRATQSLLPALIKQITDILPTA